MQSTSSVSDPASRIRAAYSCGEHRCACKNVRGNVHCPLHTDPTPSLGVDWKADKLLVVCRAGCDQSALIDRLKADGLWPDRVDPQDKITRLDRPQHVASYRYMRDGQLVATKHRLAYATGEKTFRWERPGLAGAGLHGLSQNDLPLYGEHLLQERPNDVAIFVEGEKSAERCWQEGLLAVTHAGGASIKEFGDSLQPLYGRTVFLMADNDAPGKAYMATVLNLLRGRATVHLLRPAYREEHDDAVEYFDRGGTIADLFAGVVRGEPTVEFLADDEDGVMVRYPIEDENNGVVTFIYRQIEADSREMAAWIEVAVDGSSRTVEERVRITSTSSREGLGRILMARFGGVFGKDTSSWMGVLSEASRLARVAYLGQDRTVRVADIPDSGPLQWRIEGYVPEGGPTMLMAPGSAGKSLEAIDMAVAIASGTPYVGQMVRQGPVGYLDFEGTPGWFGRRVRMNAAGRGVDADRLPLYYLHGKGIPLTRQIDAVRKAIEKHAIQVLIVDSVVAAMEGAPEESTPTRDFYAALAKLHPVVPVLTAHVSKSQISEMNKGGRRPRGISSRMPFGSAFHFNLSRCIWDLEREENTDGDSFAIAWHNVKLNEARPLASRLHRVAYENGFVTVEQADWSIAPELDKKRSIAERVATVLQDGPMDIKEISDRLDVATDVLRPRLNQSKSGGKPRFRRLADQRWALAGSGEPDDWEDEQPMMGIEEEPAEIAF
jgi:hypothetical protein